MESQQVAATKATVDKPAPCCAGPTSNISEPDHPLLQLRRKIGNRAMGHVISAKLKISDPGDVHEQEADRIADQVMRMPDPTHGEKKTISRKTGVPHVQRMCNDCAKEQQINKTPEEEEEEEEKPLQTKTDQGGIHEPSPDVAQPGNIGSESQPLPASLRDFFEPRFGYDFSQVRVHTGAEAAQSAHSLNALAYTRGHDIVFAQGHYSSETSPGRRLLAHELTHVVQQASGVVQPQSVQRTVHVGPDAAARSDILSQFNFLCPTGGFTLLGDVIESSCASAAGPGCECLCDATTDTTRNYTIDVQDATRNDRPETLHDGTTVTIPDTTTGPHTFNGPNPDVVMTRSSAAMEFAVFAPDCSAIWAPNWRILGHELCGHGRLNQSYAGDKGDRAGHDSTIDTENAIAAEHGAPARGHYADPRQGESATNPVGDRSKLVFRLRDGWHFESPTACVAAPPAATVAPIATPAFRWTASALVGAEATELQGLFGLGAQVSPLKNGPLLVFNPIIGLNVVYSPSLQFQPQEFLLAMADIGLRIQQPVRGAYFDVTGNAFLGFEAQTPGRREFTGGLGVGAGAGWRWERVEVGVDVRTLFPLTENDPTRLLILGRFGYRFGSVR